MQISVEHCRANKCLYQTLLNGLAPHFKMLQYILLHSIIAGTCYIALSQELFPLLINAIEDSHFKDLKPCDILSIDHDITSLNLGFVSMKLGELRPHFRAYTTFSTKILKYMYCTVKCYLQSLNMR